METGPSSSVGTMSAVDDKAGFLVVNGTRCELGKKIRNKALPFYLVMRHEKPLSNFWDR
jgi:hypothetical protein